MTQPPPTLFVAILSYVQPLTEVDAAGADHVAWLQRGYADGVFLASGRRLPRTGGIILAKGASFEEVEARMRTDPLQERGLATVQIFPFQTNFATEAMRTAIAAAAANQTVKPEQAHD